MDDAQLRELASASPELAALREEALLAVADPMIDQAALEEMRVRFLGRKSRLTEILRSIPTLPAEQRPVVGQTAPKLIVRKNRLAPSWPSTSLA